MVRSIIAVIVSYITMFLLNFLGFVGSVHRRRPR